MPQNWNRELANRCNGQRRAINKTRAAKNCIFTFLPQRIKVFHLLVPSPTATTQQSWVTSVPGKNLETLLHLKIALDRVWFKRGHQWTVCVLQWRGGGQIIEMTTLTWTDPHWHVVIDGTEEKFDRSYRASNYFWPQLLGYILTCGGIAQFWEVYRANSSSSGGGQMPVGLEKAEFGGSQVPGREMAFSRVFEPHGLGQRDPTTVHLHLQQNLWLFF